MDKIKKKVEGTFWAMVTVIVIAAMFLWAAVGVVAPVALLKWCLLYIAA